MNRLFASTLASALALTVMTATGAASAQSYGYPLDQRIDNRYGQQPIPDRYGQATGAHYDYARVLRVDPVFDSYRSSQVGGQRCYERDTYVNGREPYYGGGYDNRGYGNGTYDNYSRSNGNEGGRTVATVIGGVLGAVVGSQVGGGSGRYVTSAIGSMVGGIAGREIYEQNQRSRNRGGTGTVRVCDPVPADGYYSSNRGYEDGYSNDRAVNAYDVTYEYAGRSYTTRTNHHPGDRIRVRVDVRPE